jgi:hypothetical protein
LREEEVAYGTDHYDDGDIGDHDADPGKVVAHLAETTELAVFHVTAPLGLREADRALAFAGEPAEW